MQPQPQPRQPITSPSLRSNSRTTSEFASNPISSVRIPPSSTAIDEIPSCLLRPCEPTHERTVLFHRLFLTTPSLHFLLNKPPQCQEKRPANGLNAPIFDPRNHSRPAILSRPPWLSTVPIIYVQVRVRTQPCRRRRDLAATCAPLRITW